MAIQTFIEGRVSREVAGAREALRHDAGEARRVNNIKGWIKYGALVLANVLFALFIWVFDSTTVKELIPKYVAEHMNRPTLEAAARDVITNKTAVFVSQSLRPLAQDVASIRSSITNAEQAMQRLRDEQRLIAMVSRAEALDAEALRELRSFAQGTNEMAALAHEMIRKVERTLSLDKGAAVWAAPSLQHGELRFTGPFTSDELASGLLEAGFEEGYVNVIGQERRMLFVPKLVELAHSSKDLWLINRVSLAIKDMVGVESSPWDLTPLDQWWAQHKTSYTNWPYDNFARAIDSFRRCNYREALGLFESVLAVDPTADQSRALAVACAAKLDDVPKTKQLNAGYSQKDGRWERWAKGIILLARGASNEGTRELSSLVKDFPLMEASGFFWERSDVLRNLDWRMFAESIGKTNPLAKSQVTSNVQDSSLPLKPERTNTNSNARR